MHIIAANKYIGLWQDLFDDTFKVVVCAPENEQLLIKIIELLIPGKHIKTLVLKDKENHGLSVSDKVTIFDMYCTSETGEQFIVEMQHSPQRNYADRMLCYATYPIRNQLAVKFARRREKIERGEAVDKMDYGLFPVYVVSILNFSIPHKDEKSLENGLVSRYDIRNAASGEPMSESLHFIYLELGRLKAKLGEDGKCKTLLEQFAYSTKYMHEIIERPDTFNDPLLIDLFNASEFANWPPEKQAKYDKTMRTELDIIAEKAYVREEGLAEGRAEGRAEEKKALTAEHAKKMKAESIPPEVISRVTGLGLEEIAAL